MKKQAMKKQAIIIATMTTALTLTGCFSTTHGTQMSVQQVSSTIARHKTNEAQVRAAFGEPVDTKFNSRTGIKRLTFKYDNNSQVQKALAGAGGAILGGVIGHQFGGGRGKDLATATGALAGSAIGDNAVNARKIEQLLIVDIDTRTGLVVDYEYQELGGRTQSWGIGSGIDSL
ncbi:lipoprotein [Moraxella macacae 0408225]|uniref:Lipoprotein n=1 Tax=Moraxella macacae 0408225 TaxID=1230338 RepID=L2F5T9_9GAMM|nr:glycine zipper 2TM domain-containing protein [Moraxella macacae]ELA08265.1 lipoprotein [Moraxella macacae 0408225]